MFSEGFVYQFDKSVIANQMALLIEYAQCYAFFKVVSEYLQDHKEDQEFWVHLTNVTLNDLIIKWCKVFGTDENELHWKKSSKSDGYTEFVRRLIISAFNGDSEFWKSYHEEMCHFRNTYSAHRNVGEYRSVPLLDDGFKVAACYFDFLVEELAPWAGHQPSLSEYVDTHKKITLKKLKT